jgi:hypothetical protein
MDMQEDYKRGRNAGRGSQGGEQERTILQNARMLHNVETRASNDDTTKTYNNQPNNHWLSPPCGSMGALHLFLHSERDARILRMPPMAE